MSWIEGTYLTLRPSFGDKDAIYAYRTEIGWDAAASALVFRECERPDAAFTQFGEVAVPNQSGHIYLVTNRHGQYRLITVARPTITGEMYGILTTLLAGRGSQLTPIAAPIAFADRDGGGKPELRPGAGGRRQLRAIPPAPAPHDGRAVCDVFAGLVARVKRSETRGPGFPRMRESRIALRSIRATK